MIADIIFTQGPPAALSYLVPDGTGGSGLAGRRAIARVRNKKMIGLIIASHDRSPDVELKELDEIIDSHPILSETHIAFARWLSSYYYCKAPSAFRLFLPKLLLNPDSLLVERTDQAESPELSDESDIPALIPGRRAIRVSTLKKKAGSPPGFYSRLSELEKSGILRVRYRGRARRKVDDMRVRLIKTRENSGRLGLRQKIVVSHLADKSHPTSLGQLVRQLKTTRKSVESLASRGIVEILPPDVDSREFSVQERILNPEQTHVVSEVTKGIQANEFRTWLLHGVTGSGKTEVYVKLIWNAIDRGRNALLLQPEIGLSEDIYARLKDRFGNRVVRLHSNVTDHERYDIFQRIRSGEVRIVIGPRSALFSPLANPGIVIVDEEHDGSYKQSGSAPYYQGRDAAVVWGKLNSCPVLLGSATPSVESWGNAQHGKYSHLVLARRWDDREMPEIKTVVHDPDALGVSPLSEHLERAIDRDLADGAQSVLFLNRRGFAPVIKCRTCRAPLRCPNCDVGLVYHKQTDSALCHLCGYVDSAIDRCSVCESTDWGYYGSGTQRLEDALAERFPSARIARLDIDATGGTANAAKTFTKFRSGKIDILVGTQMVAKGLDFPGIRTVGVISADAASSMPDFRAAERTYALVFQAAGRAGRGRFSGEVIVQIENEASPLRQLTRESRYEDFLAEEYYRRERLKFPPVRRLILVRFKSGSKVRLEEAVDRIGVELKRLRNRYRGYMSILGPAPAPFLRIKNNFRWHLLLKTQSVSSGLDFLGRFLDLKRIQRILDGIQVVVDVDPYDMM